MMTRTERHKRGNAAWYLKNKGHVMRANATWRRANPDYWLWLNAKKRANKQGLEFDLSAEHVKSLVAPMVCSVTGISLSWTWDGQDKNPWGPSLDRIDNAKGYTVDNVRVVCWIFNLAKSTWTDDVVERFRRGR